MLWQRLPKDVYVGLRTVLFGLYDCICHFNNRNSGTRDILKHAGVDPGYYTTVACHSRDRRRLKNAKRQSTADEKQARKKRRAAKRSHSERVAVQEGPSYEPGGF